MENQRQITQPRVVKVNSEESWDFFQTQANNNHCPVFVHFTASWCFPSVAMNPFFEGLANNYTDILFITVDVDEVKSVAKNMVVKAMPTFVLLKDGNVLSKWVGANPQEIRKKLQTSVVSLRAVDEQ